MLKSLTIKNYALIQNLKLVPGQSLNVITGETGAGKSIMLGAIGLLMGKRADKKTLYDEEEKCVVEGEFDVSQYALKAVFEENDLDYDEQCILRREISPAGKSRVFVNDTPVTLETVKTIASALLDIHSQHDTLLLGSSDYQLSVVDAIAQNAGVAAAHKQAFQNYSAQKKYLEELLESAEKLAGEQDYNSYLLEELQKAELDGFDMPALEEELKIQENTELIQTKVASVVNALSGSDFSAEAGIRTAVSELAAIAPFSEKYADYRNRVESALIEIRDISSEMENAASDVVFDFRQVEYLRGKLDNVYRLFQKHKLSSVPELLELRSALDQKVSRVLNFDSDIKEAKAKLKAAEEKMDKAASALTKSREAVFAQTETELVEQLRKLGMPDAVFKITRTAKKPAANGADLILFLFSANKGIAPQDLKNTASGGELSRVMLCIKYILAGKTSLPTIIFDEIDTGISGETANKMGAMMMQMSAKHQIIAITHLPQIAAKGSSHFFVYKDNSNEKSATNIRALSKQDRVSEISKMIGGENPSENAVKSAQDLLNDEL